MWIVAIGWSYVVILMAATETSFIAGVMTFLVYCMIPLSLLFYLTGAKRRRARRAEKAAAAAAAAAGPGKVE
jgi:amino acid transporter